MSIPLHKAANDPEYMDPESQPINQPAATSSSGGQMYITLDDDRYNQYHDDDDDEDVSNEIKIYDDSVSGKNKGVKKVGLQDFTPRMLFKRAHSTTITKRDCALYSVIAALAVAVVVMGVSLIGRSSNQVLPSSHGASKFETSGDGVTCQTAGCVEASSRILRGMDLSVDPCDDFYLFACGGWEQEHKIPQDRSLISQFDLLSTSEMGLMRRVMDAPDPEGMTRAISPLTAKMRTMYQSCMNTSHISQSNIEPLVPLMQLLSSNFPYGDTVTEFSQSVIPNDFKTLEFWKNLGVTVAEFHRRGIPVIFRSFVSADRRDPTKYSLYVSQSGLGMPGPEYYNTAANLDQYQNVIWTAFDKILNTDQMKSRLEELRESAPQTMVMQLLEDAHEIVEFEVNLAKISEPTQSLSDADRVYFPMSVPELENQPKQLIWRSYFERFFGSETDRLHKGSPLTVVNQTPAFFEKLQQLIDETPSRIIRHYFVWHMLLHSSMYLDMRYQSPLIQLRDISPDIPESNERWYQCNTWVSQYMGEVVGRAFIDQSFDDKDFDQSNIIAGNVREAFKRHIKKMPWLDEKTRRMALEKVDTMRQKVGYAPYLRDDEYLLSRYTSLKVQVNDYFGNAMRAREFNVDMDLKRLGQPVDQNLWDVVPQEINSYYDATRNEVVIPAATLQAPFYDAYVPPAFNYGSLGSLIAHELFHAIDQYGRRFDQQGRDASWWSPVTAVKFQQHAQCFVDQYSSGEIRQSYESRPSDNRHVNGSITLVENLADNVGAGVALGASRQRASYSRKSLPAMAGLNDDQLFFLGYAQTWCANIRYADALRWLRTDNHAPPRLRVNTVLGNMPEFAQAFQCKPKTTMSPEKRCSMG